MSDTELTTLREEVERLREAGSICHGCGGTRGDHMAPDGGGCPGGDFLDARGWYELVRGVEAGSVTGSTKDDARPMVVVPPRVVRGFHCSWCRTEFGCDIEAARDAAQVHVSACPASPWPAALAAARREGAEQMRERAARVPWDPIMAQVIRALDLAAPGAEGQQPTNADAERSE